MNFTRYMTSLEEEAEETCLKALHAVGALPGDATEEDVYSLLGEDGCKACPASESCPFVTSSVIICRWYDENGDRYRVGREGRRHFVETIAPAFSPNAGKVTREYMPEKKAKAFSPGEKILTGLDFKLG